MGPHPVECICAECRLVRSERTTLFLIGDHDETPIDELEDDDVDRLLWWVWTHEPSGENVV